MVLRRTYLPYRAVPTSRGNFHAAHLGRLVAEYDSGFHSLRHGGILLSVRRAVKQIEDLRGFRRGNLRRLCFSITPFLGRQFVMPKHNLRPTSLLILFSGSPRRVRRPRPFLGAAAAGFGWS